MVSITGLIGLVKVDDNGILSTPFVEGVSGAAPEAASDVFVYHNVNSFHPGNRGYQVIDVHHPESVSQQSIQWNPCNVEEYRSVIRQVLELWDINMTTSSSDQQWVLLTPIYNEINTINGIWCFDFTATMFYDTLAMIVQEEGMITPLLHLVTTWIHFELCEISGKCHLIIYVYNDSHCII